MAIIKLGGTVVGIRGTIGGVTYSANKSGPYAKAWGSGPNQRTPLQTDQRGTIAGAGDPWRSLTESERDDWNTYAADPAQELTNSLGEPYYASGWNWFTKIYGHQVHRGVTPTLTAPTFGIASALPVTDFTYDATGTPECSITYSGGYFGSSIALVIFMKIVNGPGVLIGQGSFTYVFYDNAPDNTFTDFTAAVVDRFGPLISGTRATIRVIRERPFGVRGPETVLTTTSP